MQAIQYQSFGQSDVLVLTEVAQPQISNENEVLIQVKAASVNPLDMKIRMGFMQKMRPVQLPYIPGLDAAGIVVEIGSQVTRFNIGDEVMASSMGGAYAEFLVANEDNVSLKPHNISFNEAAALLVPIATAQSVLINVGQLQQGQRLLIQGASGAVGAVMIQMAKAMGAYIIGTASGKGVAMITALGVDEAIDYKTQNVSDLVKAVDLAVDCAGGEAQIKLFGLLKKGGKLLSITTPPSAELAQQHEITAQFVSSNMSHKSLEFGLELLQQGKLKPIISKTFPLAEAAQAQDFVSGGGVNGKVVLELG